MTKQIAIWALYAATGALVASAAYMTSGTASALVFASIFTGFAAYIIAILGE